ncbi:MAG TPA: ABC transporter substrate-binding protein [Trueperaceae bacterium]|nr:ABC transporter substrate-binding protein [Trueperaceae bacterium]
MRKYLKVGVVLLALAVPSALAQSCTVTIGSVMALTGSLGVLGQAIAQGAQLAVSDLNAAGGVNGCTVKLSLSDDQTQANVGVDAAKKLVDVQHVPAIVGALSSGITTAILTSVSAPAHVILISPASTSPTLTDLGKQGKTGGYFFRTAPSDALQGIGMAKYALDGGVNRVAVMYLNNAYGQGLADQFSAAFKKLGGTVTQSVVYNPDQPSYRSEVNKALGGNPQALFLIGYPGDGTTIAREWVASGGPQTWLLPDGLEDQHFVDDVGSQYFKSVYGTAPGSTTTPSLATFRKEFQDKFGQVPTQAYVTNAYDATVIVGLAMEYAGTNTDTAKIRDAMYKVTDPKGQKVFAGVNELETAHGLMNLGTTVQYVGATGPLTFNQYGDVAGPYNKWTVQKGKVVETGQITVDQIQQVQSQMGQ